MENDLKSIFIKIIFIILILFSFNDFALAEYGTPHIIYSKVSKSDGSIPDPNNISIYSYNPLRPNEILNKSSVGCGYDIFNNQGILWFEIGNFETPWSLDEKIRVVVADPNETEEFYLTLNTSGNQSLNDVLTLENGDNVGPITSNTLVNGLQDAEIIVGTGNVNLTSFIDDTILGNSNIQTAEYYVDTDPGEGLGIPMDTNNAFDETSEDVNSTIDTSSWEIGKYSIFVRGKDEAGNWGAPHMVSISIVPQKALPAAAGGGDDGGGGCFLNNLE